MVIAKAFLLVLFLTGLALAQELPPDMLADLYLLEAVKALESGDRQQALQKIEALDVEPPPLFAYLYGKLLVEQGAGAEAWRRGQALLTQFAIATGRDSEYYPPTLELLLAVAAKLAAAESQARFEDRLPELRQRLNAQLVRVEGGSFAMGCTSLQESCAADEKPVHSVRIGSFLIGKYEVTQELWEAVMGENPSAFADCPRCPVETVSWDDVQIFLRRLNTGGSEESVLGGYRLPTEAEWEYAARGGQRSQGYRYAGSDSWAEVAWYYENSDNRTQPVGQKRANELGLFDMSGNVREWVQDCWQGSYVGAPSDGRAWEQGDCSRRVIRGGSWYGKPSYVRSANRLWYATYFRNNNLGFRIALTPEE
ncbi:MAG: formylglycine-generating enzyme family protein [Truepera sp.]|nr:formylglycine-generating enzyme family protein [Truepera sp.]